MKLVTLGKLTAIANFLKLKCQLFNAIQSVWHKQPILLEAFYSILIPDGQGPGQVTCQIKFQRGGGGTDMGKQN